jgi:phytoene synthase
MEEGWAAIVPGEVLTGEALETYAAARGGRLFALAARLLAGTEDREGEGGRLWALVDLARHITDKDERQAVLAAAANVPRPGRWPKRLRPIGMLAALARRDLARGPERPGSPARMLRMMAHRVTGR